MKKLERPKLEGRAASVREKLGALIAGKPLHVPGAIAYHREDFADVARLAKAEDPLVMARRMARIFKSDHEKLDKLTNRDEIWNEMDYDAVCGGARRRYEDALHGARLSIQVDEAYAEFCAAVTRPGSPLLSDVVARNVDSETRGFCLAEFTVERMDRGKFAGYDTIGEIARREGDAYRLEEDEYSRPSGLEIWVADTKRFPKERRTGRSRYLNASMRPQEQVVLRPNDDDWKRFIFLTYPERGNRVAGLGRYGMAFPWYFFLLHLRQWMMVLGERTGTPIIVAEFTPPGGEAFLGEKYEITAEEMFAVLEKIQTNFRGLVPAGYKLSALATGADGLGALLLTLYTVCRSMCEVAILGEEVSSGANASVGTAGANQTIMATTFGGHVSSGHRRIAGRLAPLLEYLIEINFGQKVDVECSFEALDPAREAAKIANAQAGISIGAISKHEPWIRELLGAPALDDKLLQETQAARSDAERYGLTESAGEAPASDGASTDDVLEIIDRVQDGDIGDALAATLLAPKLGATVEEAARVVAQERARRAGTVAAVSATADDGAKVVLTPSDLASITTVDEGRASAGLPPIGGPDGALTIAEFTAKRAAAAEVTGEAAGQAETPGTEPAATAAKPGTFSDVQIASYRMRGAMSALRQHIRKDYNTSEPPPITSSLSMVAGAFCGVANRPERERRAKILRGQIQDGLAVALADVASDADALVRFDEMAAYFCDPATLEEFRAGLPAPENVPA